MFLGILFAGWSVPATSDDLAARQPNVVVVLADDSGWGDLSLNGNPNIATPNIDQLAKEGAQLENFYVCAVCSPTRAEFLTGRYHTRMGVYSTSAGGERFDAAERTIAEVFQEAGYRTAAYGKWHSGMQYPYHPNARGFEQFYGFCSGHWGHYFDPLLEHNGAMVQGSGFIIDDLTGQAMRFMSAENDKPFFVYLALNTPHSPMQVPDSFWDRFADKEIVPDPQKENAKKENVQHTRAALAMVENIDANMGVLLNHLNRLEIADDTIVVYFSDNGPNGSRFNGGLRGRKGSTHEGGLRSACVVRYPRRIQSGTQIKKVGGAIDLLPTLAEFAGIDWSAGVKPDRPLDGISLVSELVGEKATKTEDRVLYSSWRNKLTARTQQYRMHGDGRLFDIQKDRGESKNIAKEKPDVAKRLLAAIESWRDSWSGGTDKTNVKTPANPPSRPFTLGHPDAIWTQLPARDATYTGQIERSNRFPNCSYLLNWNDTESEIHWDVDVLGSGRHAVQLYYACPKADVGSTVELALGDQVISAKIEQPAESPILGKEEDRLPRQEGYVRRWKSMELGTFDLQPGKTTLRLKATEIPGSQVAEMRLLMFKRLP